MKKVIDLSLHRRALLRSKDPELDKMMRVSDDIDAVVQEALNANIIEPKNLASVLAHRLGYFISIIPLGDQDRDVLLKYVLELILKLNNKRADL